MGGGGGAVAPPPPLATLLKLSDLHYNTAESNNKSYFHDIRQFRQTIIIVNEVAISKAYINHQRK